MAAIRPPATPRSRSAFAVLVDDGAALEEEIEGLGHSNMPPL